MKKTVLWIGALAVGTIIGLLSVDWLNEVMNFVATIYTRLFQLLAVPTIVLAVITTLATVGAGSGRIFKRTLLYTLLTTFAAAGVGALLYMLIAPGNMAPDVIGQNERAIVEQTAQMSYYEHLISIVPNNIVRPFLEGNVMSLLLLAFAIGFGLSKLPDSENKAVVIKFLAGLQSLLFLMIRGLIWTLPLGIVAFSAQLSAELSAGVVAEALGKYVLVVLGGNMVQFFIVLPLFLLARGLNPLHVMDRMGPAVMLAMFTKSSAAALPLTIDTAETRMGISQKVARFVLPICTTINMNGCAAFVLVTSLFIMQNGGFELTLPTILLWILISVIAAVGNAGVPMGCFFLTASLMSSIGAPVTLLGFILPIYAILDMFETAENVWSDSCVAAIVDKECQD